MFHRAQISRNVSIFMWIVGVFLLVAGLPGCAIDKQFAGSRVTNKEVETGTDKVPIRVTSCVNPQGLVVCERRYGAMTECSLMCKTPPNQWIERPAGYGGYEDRGFTRYILTLQSPSGAIKKVQTSQSQYQQVSVGQILGEAPIEPVMQESPESRQTDAGNSVAPRATPIAAAAPAQPGPGAPALAMTLAEAQRKLAGLGFDPGPADGVAGGKTSRALRAFQTARRIPVSGQLDAATIDELRR